MQINNSPIQRKIYTVSELTSDIKALLEENFPFIWIQGEISNFRTPVSGHFYFTLKDENAQINAVIFRRQNQNLKFTPENGMSVTGFGRITVYEYRGVYQIILEHLEPRGVGALHLAFEQLKARLFAEGLFDEKKKSPLPFLPQKISIITSPTGAVVYDILKIIDRRFPNVQIEIIPVKVQGDGAENEIVSGIKLLNDRADTATIPDVAILARGGGSIEDLLAFNSESVARAIFVSKVPIVSAVGHETDFTIADFVADLRAPTPSAAAELVVPLKYELSNRCSELLRALKSRFYKNIEQLRILLGKTSKRLLGPKKKTEDLKLRIDDLTARLVRTFIRSVHQRHERLAWRVDRLNTNNPLIGVKKANEKLKQYRDNLLTLIKIYLNNRYFLLRELTGRLHVLSPAAILARGYSITRTIPDAVIIKDSKAVTKGQDLEVMVAKGSLIVKVEKEIHNGRTNL